MQPEARKERGMGIVSLYILVSLNKKPQSGYDLLRLIEEKTSGKWVPSKGTLYPMINNMQKESLIKVKKTGKRSKKVFELTNKGRKALSNINKFHSGARERIMRFRNILTEIFGEHIADYGELMLEMKELVFAIDSSKKNKVLNALKRCVSDLEKLK